MFSYITRAIANLGFGSPVKPVVEQRRKKGRWLSSAVVEAVWKDLERGKSVATVSRKHRVEYHRVFAIKHRQSYAKLIARFERKAKAVRIKTPERGMADLSDFDIRAIAESPETVTNHDLAKRYNIRTVVIWRVRNRRSPRVREVLSRSLASVTEMAGAN